VGGAEAVVTLPILFVVMQGRLWEGTRAKKRVVEGKSRGR
jgi:hypothetical protein